MAAQHESEPKRGEVTECLARFKAGDQEAGQKVLNLLYRELHRLARRHMSRERPGHTLQTTALLHEAYMELVEGRDQNWQNRAHFLATAAQAMRRILIDYARARVSQKRGGQALQVAIDGLAVAIQLPEDYLALDQALDRLAAYDPELIRIVEMRYFGGLTEEEIGEALGQSSRTVKRRWRVAKSWLAAELKDSGHVKLA